MATKNSSVIEEAIRLTGVINHIRRRQEAWGKSGKYRLSLSLSFIGKKRAQKEKKRANESSCSLKP
ncbi:MAG: hypothetical protein WCH05_04750 [Chlorobiaceae bacterium]